MDTLGQGFIGALTYDPDLDVLWASGTTSLNSYSASGGGLYKTTQTVIASADVAGWQGMAYNIDNNSIYGMTRNGEIYRVNDKIAGGTTFVADIDPNDLEFETISGLAYTDGKLYASSGTSKVWEIDPTDGADSWSYLGKVTADAPTRGDGLAPIPEPASLALLGLGGLFMLRRRSR